METFHQTHSFQQIDLEKLQTLAPPAEKQLAYKIHTDLIAAIKTRQQTTNTHTTATLITRIQEFHIYTGALVRLSIRKRRTLQKHNDNILIMHPRTTEIRPDYFIFEGKHRILTYPIPGNNKRSITIINNLKDTKHFSINFKSKEDSDIEISGEFQKELTYDKPIWPWKQRQLSTTNRQTQNE